MKQLLITYFNPCPDTDAFLTSLQQTTFEIIVTIADIARIYEEFPILPLCFNSILKLNFNMFVSKGLSLVVFLILVKGCEYTGEVSYRENYLNHCYL